MAGYAVICAEKGEILITPLRTAATTSAKDRRVGAVWTDRLLAPVPPQPENVRAINAAAPRTCARARCGLTVCSARQQRITEVPDLLGAATEPFDLASAP